MLRKLIGATVLIGAVLAGLLAQAGSYLLALPAQDADEIAATQTAGDPFSAVGPHPVGVRHVSDDGAPTTLTVWYPASPGPDADSVTYSYAINMAGPESSIALATYRGNAGLGLSPDPEGPFPVVVLSHGFAITPDSYGWLAEHLASWGFIVAAPQHAESLDPSALWRSAVERPDDVADVLALLRGPTGGVEDLAGLADVERVAVVGHSYGGYTALAAAGARIDPEGFASTCNGISGEDPLSFLCDALTPNLTSMARAAGVPSGSSGLWPALVDETVDAAVAIAGDAAMFGERGLAEVTVPVLAIGGTADVDSPFRWGTRLTYDHVSSAQKVEVAFEGAGHLVFAGGCSRVRRILSLVPMGFCSDPVWERNDVHRQVRGHVTGFLLAELEGQVDAISHIAGYRPGTGLGYRSEGF